MPAFKYTISRVAVIEEQYTVEADSLEHLRELIEGGAIDYDNCLIGGNFLDWHTDEWEVLEKEDLCPLTKMIKDYGSDITSPCGTAMDSST